MCITVILRAKANAQCHVVGIEREIYRPKYRPTRMQGIAAYDVQSGDLDIFNMPSGSRVLAGNFPSFKLALIYLLSH